MCRVWSRFKSKKSGQHFRILDVPRDRMDDVIELFLNYFSKEETVHKAAGIHESKEAMAENREFVKALIGHDKNISVTICCLDEDPNIVGEIIGASLVTTITQNQDEDTNMQARTEPMKKMMKAFDVLFGSFDVLKSLNLDSCYDDRGLVVHPEYRGHGIAQEFFNVRRKICIDESVPMTGAWMTSYGSQKAAERGGWETVFEYSYEEFGKQSGLNFQEVPDSIKFMVAKI